jgi:O-antigen ligase
LHLDINVILHGSGLIGLVIFIFFFAEVLVLFLKIGFQPETTTDRIIWSTFLTFYLAMLFLIFSGGMTTVTHNMIGSIIMGATLGLMSSQRKLTDNQNNPKILKPFSFDWPKRAT